MSAKNRTSGENTILNKLFGRNRKAGRNGRGSANRRGRKLQMEGLEKREMFAVSSLYLNQIYNYNPYAAPEYAVVIGTDNSSTSVSVSQSGSSLTVNDNTTNRHWDFPASLVKRVDFYGGNGADRFVNYISTMPIRAFGGGGNDYLEGYSAADELYGGENNDTLVGFGGNDILRGGNGNDVIQGNSGEDYLYGEGGNDHIDGGSELDRIWGGENDDTLLGGAGDDHLIGEGGNDQLNGQAGVDQMWGGTGNDVLISIDGAFGDYSEGGTDSDVLWIDKPYSLSQVSDRTAGVTSADTVQQVGFFANGADRTLDGDNIADPTDIGTKARFTNTITADNIRGSNPLFAGAGFTMTSSGVFLPTAAGPKSTDVVQGNLGNCWITAPLSSMALVNPNVITQNVVDFNDGTYGVRLGNSFYRVDNELGVKNTANGAVSSNLEYAKLGSQNSMWVAVVEKAFAAYSGAATYKGLKGGHSYNVFNAFRMNGVSDGYWLSSTYGSATYMANDFYNRYLNGYSQTIGIKTNSNGAHAFTVAGFTRDAAGAIAGIVLRNPWGYDGIASFNAFASANTGSSTQDGVFTISISALYNSGAWTDWARA